MNSLWKNKKLKSKIQLVKIFKIINNRNPTISMMIKIKFNRILSKLTFTKINLCKMIIILAIMYKPNKNFKKGHNQVKFIKIML